MPAIVLACRCAVRPAASAFALALFRPSLWIEINALAAGRGASREALAEALFAGPMETDGLERIYARMQAESRRALMDMAWWGLPQAGRVSPPQALVLAAVRDALISPALTESAARLLGAEYRLLDGLGHAMMLDALGARSEALLAWVESGVSRPTACPARRRARTSRGASPSPASAARQSSCAHPRSATVRHPRCPPRSTRWRGASRFVVTLQLFVRFWPTPSTNQRVVIMPGKPRSPALGCEHARQGSVSELIAPFEAMYGTEEPIPSAPCDR